MLYWNKKSVRSDGFIIHEFVLGGRYVVTSLILWRRDV